MRRNIPIDANYCEKAALGKITLAANLGATDATDIIDVRAMDGLLILNPTGGSISVSVYTSLDYVFVLKNALTAGNETWKLLDDIGTNGVIAVPANSSLLLDISKCSHVKLTESGGTEVILLGSQQV